MRALMVQGCTSWAGKSLLTTVLCRWASDHGFDVAPFKAQNMANNARVTPQGEIGVAQWLQARAARVAPHVDHNPVLLKPEGDTRSQVVVHGRVDESLTATPWRERPPRLWDAAVESLDRLRERHELLVVEGAGSPAEINLTDIVNGRVARHLDASVLLVADIDRGGAFAHLYGTWALVDDDARARLAGFVLNRFRGDPTLLAPGPRLLEERTGVPTLGLVPMLRHALPDEDGARDWAPPAGRGRVPRVAIVAGPAASNLDEFAAVAQVAEVVWARSPADLAGSALIVLPGSKHVARDRAWLAESGLDHAITRAVGTTRVLGICGGAMMLGDRIVDRLGVEGGRPGDVSGLGLLPLVTVYEREKLLRHGSARFAARLPHEWRALSGLGADDCYEIRHGRLTSTSDVDPATLTPALDDGLGWALDGVLATTAHGLLEDPAVVSALLDTPPPTDLDDVLDELTAAVVPHLDTDRLLTTIGARP